MSERSTDYASVGGGATDVRLPAAHLPGFYTTHAQDRRQVWTRITTGPSTYDTEAIHRCWRPGMSFIVLLFFRTLTSRIRRAYKKQSRAFVPLFITSRMTSADWWHCCGRVTVCNPCIAIALSLRGTF